ncbi:MAG: PD40 domain-containing protein [Bacteroidales bacterium]|nr:PD40 domain-containing protein [Bacteroidales bacterium]
MKNLSYLLLLVLAISVTSCLSNYKESSKSLVIRGDYFGQTPPGDSARLFAPGIISTGMNERDFAITPDGNEIFFCREAGNYRYATIFYSRRSDDVWSSPEVFEFCTNPEYKYIEPHLSPDGTKLYFISTMTADSASEGNEDIWVCTKRDGEWSEPRNLGAPVNATSKEYFPSVTVDGTIYYTHPDTATNEESIFRSRLVDGAYQVPEKLGPNVNIGRARYNAFVAPDESYIIIPAYGMPDSFGATDYYISFRDSLDNWSQPVNMGPGINSTFAREWSASVSTDGNYLFFMSDRMGSTSLGKLSTETLQGFHNSPQNGNTDIYWISTKILDELREKARF